MRSHEGFMAAAWGEVRCLSNARLRTALVCFDSQSNLLLGCGSGWSEEVLFQAVEDSIYELAAFIG